MRLTGGFFLLFSLSLGTVQADSISSGQAIAIEPLDAGQPIASTEQAAIDAGQAADALAALEAFLRGLRTLHAGFTQTLYDERGKTLEVSSGLLDLQRPGHFRWEYKEPYQQLIVADGKSIWVYDKDLDQVTIKNFDDSTQNTPALLLSSERPLTDLFTVEALPNSPAGERQVELLPKAADAQFASMLILFSAHQLLRLHVEDKLGQTSVIVFGAQTPNPTLDAALFEFVPPPDADLIDGRE